MKHITFAAILLISGLLLPAAAMPESCFEKADAIPDLCQKINRYGYKVNDSFYCAPVAASNGIIWLSQNGFSNLARGYMGYPNQQAHFARLLASNRYMEVRAKGVSVVRFMNGLYRYVLEHGYKPSYMGYQGWKKHPKAFSKDFKKVPDLNWIKNGIVGNSLECLNIGFYSYDKSSNTFTRASGHWITLVGYGINEKGKLDPSYLLVHDPAPRNGLSKVTHYIKIAPLQSGKIRSKQVNFPARGYFRILSGMKSKKGKYTIIDGAVVLKLK